MSKSQNQNKKLFFVLIIFLIAFYMPFSSTNVQNAVLEAFLMLSEYAREHVLLCLVPAFFIAAAIMVFLNKNAVIKYFGPQANKFVAFSVASVSGAIMAVCSCTILPLFKGIYKKGAGLGPAIAFLYSGPAINILAIVLTAKVLGFELGIARAVGAIVFAFVIGLMMQVIFRKGDQERLNNDKMFEGMAEKPERSLWQSSLHIFTMIGVLVFLNWAPSKGSMLIWDLIYANKYLISFGLLIFVFIMLIKWFNRSEMLRWVQVTRNFSLQIMPLLFGGVLLAGFLLGRPGHMGLISTDWVGGLVGGNSIQANLIAAVSGAFMYFATLTEIPIMQGLIGAGMGKGPSLALLLAGPSLSLPSMIVIGNELGLRKTLVYILLVVSMSTLVGLGYGYFFA